MDFIFKPRSNPYWFILTSFIYSFFSTRLTRVCVESDSDQEKNQTGEEENQGKKLNMQVNVLRRTPSIINIIGADGIIEMVSHMCLRPIQTFTCLS